MRADRLVAIVLLLQTHGQLTAGGLAERLETSERTIRRDLDALSMAGVPVYAQRGRGGGWALLGGHRIDLSGLTADEAKALFLVTGPGSVAGLGADGTTVGSGVEAALRKVLAALPEPLRAQVAAARSAVLVDQGRWGQPPDRPPHLDALRSAVVDGVQVDVSYARPGRQAEDRRLHPHGLVCKRGVWYLLATSPSGLRTYRVSRFDAVRAADEPAVRPDGFDLAEEWERVQRELPRSSASLAVEVDVHPEGSWRLNAVVGSWCRIEVGDEAGEGGRRRYTIWFPDPAVAAVELAPFGETVEVVSPPEVRAELAAIGRRLVDRYEPAARAVR